MGGLHRFMSWPNAILTDSGGFQVFSLSGLRKITDEGVIFQSHLDGDLHTFTPRIHRRCATGLRQRHPAWCWTNVPNIRSRHEYARAEHAPHGPLGAAGYRAHHRAGCRKALPHTRCSPSCRAPCSPICGASAPRALVDLDADGYAIGGLSVGEPRALSMEMVEATADILPRHKPRYAMGVGMPAELPEYVARGVDMMDCVLPSRNARNGYLVHIRGPRDHQTRETTRMMTGPIDENCQCYTCQKLFPLVPAPFVPGRGNPLRVSGHPPQPPAVP